MCCDVNSRFQSIEDLVFVEEKIVTFRCLSQRLNIHTNTAKQILYSFSKRSSKEPLVVTYVISGLLKNEKGSKVMLIKECDLDNARDLFSSIQSEHIYSIQKASVDVKSCDLFLANTECTSSDISLSAIRTRNIPERKFKIVIPDKPKDIPVKPIDAPSKLKNAQKEDKTNKSLNDEPVAQKNYLETFGKNNSTKEEISGKSKSPVKTSPKKVGKKNDKKNVPKGGGIGAFFNKQMNNMKQEKKKTSVDLKPNEQNKLGETDDTKQVSPRAKEVNEGGLSKTDKSPSTTNKTEVTNKEKNKVVPVAKKKSAQNKNKRKKSPENDSSKKRKRIMLASDSESSNDEMEVEEEVFYEEPPPAVLVESDEEIIPPTPVAEKGRKRIRKEIDRNYEDEDGFIITKKESVYESCSDEECVSTKSEDKEQVAEKNIEVLSENKTEEKENDIERKENKNKTKPKKTKNKSPKKSISPNKSKQSSLMSFFKKK